jgi:hypothetical protein
MKTNGEPEILGTILIVDEYPIEMPYCNECGQWIGRPDDSDDRGDLFWRDGEIWCRHPESHDEWTTGVPCAKPRNALRTIAETWGERRAIHKVWGLRLRTRQAERYYGLR